jgi:hypothetical protein
MLGTGQVSYGGAGRVGGGQQLGDGGLPGRGERRQCLQRGRLSRGSVDRPHILGDGGPVPPGGVAEAVA